jgi:hypothetical protein
MRLVGKVGRQTGRVSAAPEFPPTYRATTDATQTQRHSNPQRTLANSVRGVLRRNERDLTVCASTTPDEVFGPAQKVPKEKAETFSATAPYLSLGGTEQSTRWRNPMGKSGRSNKKGRPNKRTKRLMKVEEKRRRNASRRKSVRGYLSK